MSTGKTISVLVVSVFMVLFGILFLFSLGIVSVSADSHEKLSDDSGDVVYEDPYFLHSGGSTNYDSYVYCPLTDGDDGDDDGIFDQCDNCPLHYNPEQRDDDLDGHGNVCDLTLGSESYDSGNNEIECSVNLDCGTDGYIGGPFCTSDDVYQEFETFTCNNPGTQASYCSSLIEEVLVEECDEDCEDGECVEEPEIECTENSECGEDGFIGTTFCTGDDVYQNYEEFECQNPGTENSDCESYVYPVLIDVCDNTCSNGECVEEPEIECYLDVECDDSNPLTYDQCVNPGTEQSYCSNTVVSCASDGDCGEEGFVGNEYCIEDDIYQDYRSYMCIDPGWLSSWCDSETEPLFVQSCENACSQGTCIACDEDVDCDDGNSLTEDECVFPGTVLSYCEYEQIGECTPGETKSCGYSNVGQCQLGTETCYSSGYWSGTCDGAVYPSTEVCDGVDNNCDGNTDEGGACAPAQCDDNLDNDGDGLVDWPADPGCSSKLDDSEDPFNYKECNDGIDNDGDGWIDWPNDAGCSNPFDNSEAPYNYPQCDDNIDNDGDGKVDWPADPQCSSKIDNNESQ
jgi:hypothetical protein